MASHAPNLVRSNGLQPILSIHMAMHMAIHMAIHLSTHMSTRTHLCEVRRTAVELTSPLADEVRLHIDIHTDMHIDIRIDMCMNV